MQWLANLFRTSVGRKQLMALTGLGLSGFLVVHLSGNLLLFAGDGGASFNAYAAWLHKQPWLVPAELGLVGMFVLHIYLAFSLTSQNRRARPTSYYFKADSDATLGSRTMILSGLLVFFFILVHLANFKFGDATVPGGKYGMVVATFQDPLYASFYVLMMVVLALHLSHGIQSALQTFGVNHPKYTPMIKQASMLFALALGAGFASMPLWFFLFQGGF